MERSKRTSEKEISLSLVNSAAGSKVVQYLNGLNREVSTNKIWKQVKGL